MRSSFEFNVESLSILSEYERDKVSENIDDHRTGSIVQSFSEYLFYMVDEDSNGHRMKSKYVSQARQEILHM